MSSQKFAGIFAAIFILGALPLILVQPSGAASAGLSAGFVRPLGSFSFLFILIAVGVWATCLGREAIVLLPISFLLMVVVSSSLEISTEDFPGMKLFIYGAIMLFAVSISLITHRAFLASVFITSSFAYHMGGGLIASMPDIASPLYFLLGIIISLSLVLAAGVSFGMTIVSEVQMLMEKFRNLPAISSFLSLF